MVNKGRAPSGEAQLLRGAPCWTPSRGETSRGDSQGRLAGETRRGEAQMGSNWEREEAPSPPTDSTCVRNDKPPRRRQDGVYFITLALRAYKSARANFIKCHEWPVSDSSHGSPHSAISHVPEVWPGAERYVHKTGDGKREWAWAL